LKKEIDNDKLLNEYEDEKYKKNNYKIHPDQPLKKGSDEQLYEGNNNDDNDSNAN